MNTQCLSEFSKIPFAFSLSLILGSFLMISSPKAKACSVHINQEETKNEMRNALAVDLGLSATSFQNSDLSKPAHSFLAGLGADCSGLESAVITSAYNFSIVKNFKKCTYRGVVIQKLSPPEGEYYFNNEPAVCVATISPFPIPGPFPRPLPHPFNPRF
jgi:hypothetical protein